MTTTPTTTTTDRPAAFDARVMAYFPGLMNAAKRYTRNNDERYDLAVDTVAKALSCWTNFREDGGLWKWLVWNMRGIASNRARDAVAKKRYGREVSTESLPQRSTPAEQEHAADLAVAVDRLSAIRHGDVLLRYATGETHMEIAGERGISRQRVRQLAEKARERLVSA